MSIQEKTINPTVMSVDTKILDMIGVKMIFGMRNSISIWRRMAVTTKIMGVSKRRGPGLYANEQYWNECSILVPVSHFPEIGMPSFCGLSENPKISAIATVYTAALGSKIWNRPPSHKCTP
jgi:hypothetical protein